MGYAKRSVKNKARVEGSICASYLHRETTHFCSACIDSDDVEVEGPYQVDEMSHVNEVIEVEQVSGLRDLEVELEEVDINNLSSFEHEIDEETNEWEEDNEDGESEDEYGDDFDISTSE